MKSRGMVRHVDRLGRIVLPKEMREAIGIEPMGDVELVLENGQIILTRFESVCVFCGSSRELVQYRGKNLCRECMENLRRV